jgi:hypothetical protein
MSIKFNQTIFTEPVVLDVFQAPSTQGIYAILVPDNQCKPKPFRVIYFGECQNFLKRGFPRNHEKHLEWSQHANPTRRLYISFFQTTMWTESQRKQLETDLIEGYTPICNIKKNPLAVLPDMSKFFNKP